MFLPFICCFSVLLELSTSFYGQLACSLWPRAPAAAPRLNPTDLSAFVELFGSSLPCCNSVPWLLGGAGRTSFWNSVAAAAEGSLLQRALADNCALAEEMGGVAIARRPWAGQVAAALASVDVGVSLAAPAAVSVKEVAAAGEDAFLAQLSDARGSKVKEYVAVTGAGTDNLSLPAYLAAIPQRSRRRALTQLRCGSHWLVEETGRWLRLQGSGRLCPHCPGRGALTMWRMLRTPSCTAPAQRLFGASLRSCSRDLVNLWPHGGGAESVACGCIGMLLPCRVFSEGFVEFWKELVRG